MVRYAKLPLPFDVKAMQSELSTAASEWQPHFNNFYYDGSWTVLALRSPGGSYKNIIPDMMGNNNEYQDTIYMEHFASVKKLLSGLNCRILAARFLNLQAGAVIKQHRDNELAFEKGEARLHFPVITNPGIEFYCEDERIFLLEGECWYLNANLPHRVSNNSDKDRIHLVVDCSVNNWLKDIINSSGKISFKDDVSDVDLINMIKNLRYQDTETSNKLAAELEQQKGK